MLSLGVPFDSLQPSARCRIQDGGRTSRTQDYVVLAAHKIRLQCRLERERRRKGENKINGEGLTQATHSYLAYIRE